MLEASLTPENGGFTVKTAKPFSQKPVELAVDFTVYTRYEHGNLLVRVFAEELSGETRYEVSFPSGKRVFSSARKMISEFYGHDVHMPFDRYFRLGKYRRASGASGLLQHFGKAGQGWGQESILVRGEISKSSGVSKTGLVISERGLDKESKDFFGELERQLEPAPSFLEWSPEMGQEFERSLKLELDRLEEKVGIDLGKRAHEVRKLLFAGFAGKMLSRGYDPEDVLQEIYRGLLVRNKGRCPWDARKSSFGHYVHMAINCILTNYHRKETRRGDRDAIPLEHQTEEGEMLPSVQVQVEIHNGSDLGDRMALQTLESYLKELPEHSVEAHIGREILPMVTAGYTRKEIVLETGYKENLISKALNWVRQQTALWATEMGLGRGVPEKWRCR
jgi:DNA-directed RNA polymerase specialized sigma24 family protein